MQVLTYIHEERNFMPVTPQSTDETREKILSAAAEVMAELGYARATTRIIAKAAGVNEVTLFRHFGSKRNLLSEMIHSRSALPDLTNIINSQLTGEYRQDLINLATVFNRMIIKRKEALRLMLCEAKEFPDVREGPSIHLQNTVAQLQSCLAAVFR